MEYIDVYEIHDSDKERLRNYFKRKGLYLESISKNVCGYAIAKVSRIEEKDDFYEQNEFMVIVNISKKICYKFTFWGHRTDGLTILGKPKNKGKYPNIYNPKLRISFVKSAGGDPTRFIQVSYTKSEYYDSEGLSDNKDGTIYVLLMNPSCFPQRNYLAKFHFNDFEHYDNSVNIECVDNHGPFFGCDLISTPYYENDNFDIDYEHDMDISHRTYDKLLCFHPEYQATINLKGQNVYECVNSIWSILKKDEEDEDNYYDDYYYDD